MPAQASPHTTALRLVEVGKITASLLVRSYQRGYRWGLDEVRTLLDDIAGVRDKDYCLQPIVVKRTAEEGTYELVDGQQRLTTIRLLFTWLRAKNWHPPVSPPFSIAYETRTQSAEFQDSPSAERAEESIDFFHMHRAYAAIDEWFTTHDKDVGEHVVARLFDRIKVIWYEVGPEVSSTELFTRLNVGRIPLTNAELVKALLLARRGDEPVPVHRQLEIGTQWDTIERELQDERRWAFLTNAEPSSYPTRIELLFELMVEPAKTRDPLHVFHRFKARLDGGDSPAAIWNDVMALHALLQDWFDDRALYHRIGFLVIEGRGDMLRSLVSESERLPKTELGAGLVAKIAARLDVARDELERLGYDTDKPKCVRALLLFNVEATLSLKESFDRYPFHLHKAQDWSLEHIHAQNAEELTERKQWIAWLDAHEVALRKIVASRRSDPAAVDGRTALADEIRAALAAPESITKMSFGSLAARITAAFEDAENHDVHRIANLALLQKDANSALNNAVFEIKRQRILAMDRSGAYIPICTRRAFLKYYTDSADQQLHVWSRQDRAAYVAAMLTTLEKYLKPAEGAA